MTATNKSFAYVINTTQEGQRVAKWLSGWDAHEDIHQLDLSCFDRIVRSKILQVQVLLFGSCADVRSDVQEVLMATIVSNYPEMVSVQAEKTIGVVGQSRRSLQHCGVSEQEMLAWSKFLRSKNEVRYCDHRQGNTLQQDTVDDKGTFTKQLLEQHRLLLDRIEKIERTLGSVILLLWTSRIRIPSVVGLEKQRRRICAMCGTSGAHQNHRYGAQTPA